MSQNVGGGRVGSAPFSAGAEVPITLLNAPSGAVDAFVLELDFSLISTAAAFNLVINTGLNVAAEGVDDMDLILATLLQSINIYYDPGQPNTANLAMARLRTNFGLLNQQDFGGSLAQSNGVSVPISSGSPAPFTVLVRCPVSLRHYWSDGDAFVSGTDRLKDGEIAPVFGASNTPTIALANGSAVVSAFQNKLWERPGPGTPADFGPTWKIRFVAGLATIAPLGPAIRMALLATGPAATNLVVSYLTEGQIDLRNVSPQILADQYFNEFLNNGGFNLPNRASPLLWYGRLSKSSDLPAVPVASSIDGSNGTATSQSFYDITNVPATGADAARTAANAYGGGTGVSTAVVAPHSVHAGQPANAPATVLRQRIMPAPSGKPQARNAAALGARQTAKTSRVNAAFARMKRGR
jgi:hypothetical protein